jgi:hypothetical protein
MRHKPDIVKELRGEENLGKSRGQSSDYEETVALEDQNSDLEGIIVYNLKTQGRGCESH